MTKTILFAALLAATLAACGGGTESTAPSALQGDKAASTPNKDANDTPAATTPTTPERTPDVSSTPAATPASCESVKAFAPVAKFEVEKLAGGILPIKPIDVYVEERSRQDPNDPAKLIHSFAIAFTETANECGGRATSFMTRSMNELRVQVDGEVAVKTYVGGDANEISFETEAGDRCITDEELKTQGGFGGTAAGASSARGTVTITKRTDTTIEGTVDVSNTSGDVVKAAFTAPICKGLWGRPATEKPVCCSK